MKLVKVTYDFFKMCKDAGADPNNQLLHNEAGRPCVLLLKLKYKGQNIDFVVPMKSNITPGTDKTTYFPLPPNKRTQPGNFHGIFYIKLFPINKKYIRSYLYKDDPYLCLVKTKIDENEKIIINACQEYLDAYANGDVNAYTPDIDAIINLLQTD
ncbi:MAG: hypothetical protein ACI4TK_14995 [Agathobacter sp.]